MNFSSRAAIRSSGLGLLELGFRRSGVPGATSRRAFYRRFRPDVVHSHHPFLLGQSAQLGATLWNTPLVYTHHTRYDVYLHTMVHSRVQ